MVDLKGKDYVAIVQCHIVKERCSGYNCERAFNERIGGFSVYPKEKVYRTLSLTCGGCCGRAVQRKLSNLVRRIKKHEGIDKDRIVVQLASCVTKDNFHSSPCPHLDYPYLFDLSRRPSLRDALAKLSYSPIKRCDEYIT